MSRRNAKCPLCGAQVRMMKIPKRDMLEISHDSRGYAAGCDTAGCPLRLWRFDPCPSKRAAWRYVTQWHAVHMRYCKNIERWRAVYQRIRTRKQSQKGWRK